MMRSCVVFPAPFQPTRPTFPRAAIPADALQDLHPLERLLHAFQSHAVRHRPTGATLRWLGVLLEDVPEVRGNRIIIVCVLVGGIPVDGRRRASSRSRCSSAPRIALVAFSNAAVDLLDFGNLLLPSRRRARLGPRLGLPLGSSPAAALAAFAAAASACLRLASAAAASACVAHPVPRQPWRRSRR